MGEALAACGAPVVASYVLAGGVLTGKYDHDPAAGRAAGTLDAPGMADAAVAGRRLAELARDLDTAPATLAVAFALANPSVASVLFGATTPAQLGQNVAALDLVERLDESVLASLAALAPEPRVR